MFYSGAGDFMPADDAESTRWMRKAAEQGLANAQFRLGLAYLSEIGEARAQVNLGRLTLGGVGFLQVYSAAFQWFQKAAAQGNRDGQYWTGVCHYVGFGTTIDFMQAYA